MKTESIGNRFDEDIQRAKFDSGLCLYLNPKKTVSRTYAAITTDFGSIDWRFHDDVNQTQVELPDGIAHFLEHKLFEDEQGDISDRFSTLGASCNARTGFTSTSYLFSCTSHTIENLRLLMGLVKTPFFPAQSVEREKGIIEQEIRMYDDDAEWRIYFNLLGALYEKHPVRVDIAGTAETIAKVTPDLLYLCHKKFYHPRNMVLSLSGNFDVESVLGVVDEFFGSSTPGDSHHRAASDEGRSVHRREVEDSMVISRPKIMIGIKDPISKETGRDRLRREIMMQSALDCLFGSSSVAFNELYDEGIIDDTFGAYYTAEDTFGFSIVGGDTDQPEALRIRLMELLHSAAQRGIEKKDFDRLNRRTVGRALRAIDSVSNNAHSFIASHFSDVEPFEDLSILEEMSVDEVNAYFKAHVLEEAISISTIQPRKI